LETIATDGQQIFRWRAANIGSEGGLPDGLHNGPATWVMRAAVEAHDGIHDGVNVGFKGVSRFVQQLRADLCGPVVRE
jgi:hypothetical protein